MKNTKNQRKSKNKSRTNVVVSKRYRTAGPEAGTRARSECDEQEVCRVVGNLLRRAMGFAQCWPSLVSVLVRSWLGHGPRLVQSWFGHGIVLVRSGLGSCLVPVQSQPRTGGTVNRTASPKNGSEPTNPNRTQPNRAVGFMRHLERRPIT